jgi:ribosomal-protein-alanine N-acetyltransferase
MSVLESERLVLRPVGEGDRENFLALWGDPEVMRHVGDGRPRTPELTTERLARAVRHWQEHGFGVWALRDRAGGGFVGGCGLGYFHALPDAEVGYVLAKAYWGRGLATEAVVRVLRHAFEAIRLPRVVGLTRPGNVASQRVMLKAGMALQGPYQYDGQEGLLYAVEAPGSRCR